MENVGKKQYAFYRGSVIMNLSESQAEQYTFYLSSMAVVCVAQKHHTVFYIKI